ncbi:LysR family transcriptional regulator [uncultured Desulfobacter sp.]|uniref:LysR family transcriptional regulator n=1 Tax=uncultured Desulfobacter sp. TaxID=240139 RepID=UPI002AAB7394|nr:LysR family transcriptional regulator [uncultured Desulfobacter sp.]
MNFTLDQLEAFSASAETGSFSAAARKLGKAQSAVSMAIANLEIDLGLELFDRAGKYPVLTLTGEMFLREAETILSRCRSMQNKAAVLAETMEGRVRLAVSETLPHLAFKDGILLKNFKAQFPETELEILSGSLNDVWDMIERDRIDFGVMMPTEILLDRWKSRSDFQIVGKMNFIPAAHPKHGLGKAGIDISALDLVLQIEVTSRGGEQETQLPVFSSRVWWVENEYLIRDLLLQGVGWGILPEHLIKEDLYAGRLEQIQVDMGEAVLSAPILMAWSKDRPLGRAGDWLFSAMKRYYS